MKSDQVSVVGAGGHGKVIIRLLQELGYSIGGIFDDNVKLHGSVILGIPVLGGTNDIARSSFRRGVIAVGSNPIRKRIAKSVDLEWLTLVHPRAIVDETVTMGAGSVVMAGAVIQVCGTVGQHVIVNTASSIDHDGQIADFVHIAPGCHLSGNISVCEGVFVGTGTSSIQGVSVGAWSTVGAGSVIVRPIPAGVISFGSPAKTVRPIDGPAAKMLEDSQTVSASMNQEKQPPRIYMSSPHMSGAERDLLLEAFDSNWIAPLGPHVDAFEREFAEFVGREHAVALSSGTAALHLSLLMLGVQPGDDVITSTLTFAATTNAIRYAGANPVFIDCDRQSWNMDPELLAEELEECAKRGRLPKAAVVVDIFGQCADYDAIAKICDFYEVPLIEDGAEGLGATYRGKPSGAFGAMACFSFNGNKIITTSGGGMLVTDSAEWARQARFLATQARDPAPHYEHSTVGYNYRLSNLLAAIGRGQLQVLPQRVRERRAVYETYHETIGKLPGLEFMPEPPECVSSRWLTCITIDPEGFGATREDIRLALEKQNIESRPVWKPMHLQPVFQSFRKRGGEVSEDLFARGLCLPSGSNLTREELARVIDIIRQTALPASKTNEMTNRRAESFARS